MSKTILMLGAFDTKGAEYAYLREQILARGHQVLAMNTGVMGSTTLFPVDVESLEITLAAGKSLSELRAGQDRGAAMRVMAEGAPLVVRRLYDAGRIDGAIGMGGTGGTSVIAPALQALPLGFPKVCVSTAAAGDVSRYVGTKDITMIPSVVDVAGINRISRVILARAAGAVCGMAETVLPEAGGVERALIAASMFGNTTECVNACVAALEKAGYEVLVFHATGTGGRTMESLIDEGYITACLDITTTEWADEICGGVFSAGPDRLSAAGRRGIPHLIVPGCVDMANFGGRETIPQHYLDAGRLFYEWNPSVTLMRTNVEENIRMGEIFARKAGEAQGPVAFLMPLRGVSILDGDGERFCDRAADRAFYDALCAHVPETVPVEEIDCNINDGAFAEKAVSMLLELIRQHEGRRYQGRTASGVWEIELE
ncbi:MAG: Tm-1-like ATP-binding domain-containing protein [Candidatus Hydrogenedentes bacterium]|nr:Tm-1-like ATP-binding domain-containing protein [Candidatus Hydrogenedentota bacterium]